MECSLHARDRCEDRPKQLGLGGVNGDWQYIARRQLQNGAIVLRKSILRKQARFQPSSGTSPEVKRGILFGARLEIEALGSDGRAAELHRQRYGSQRISVILEGDENI